MKKTIRDRRIWLILLLSVLGLLTITSMASSGRAEFPHIMAALTVLIPLTGFSLLLRSPWPTLGALCLVMIINVTLN